MNETVISFSNQIIQYLPTLAVSIAIFAGFYVAAAISKALITRVAARGKGDYGYVANLLGQVAKGALLVFGAITALGTLGINVSALVAGLGLTGFALGFALKDSLSNSLAGVMILIYKPYRRGSEISVAGESGIVASVDLRYTVLHNDENRVFIPNSMMLTKILKVSQAQSQQEK